MTVRDRRLRADQEMVSTLFANHPHIRLKEAIGDPAERYRIEYLVRGLVMRGSEVVEKDAHLVEIFLTLAYPRQPPQCRMLTPVFHPNIAPHAICIGDHWSAGESLAALIVRIGEMITFQSYNTKSPLNGLAAKWADENLARLPIQKVDLSVDAAPHAAAGGE
jgi:ubiquitin-protein ligase